MVSVSTVDGWRDILPWQETHPTAASVEPHPKQLPKARRIRSEFCDRCFNCLSFSHRVATCQLPRHCLRCRGFRHLAKNYRRPRPASTSAAKDANLPWYSARDNPPASQHAPHGDAEGAAQGAVGGASRGRRRQCRRRTKPKKNIDKGAPADHADNIATAATLRFPKPDALALARPPAWVISVHPMREELVASLVMSRPAREPASECQPTLEAASLGIEESLMDTRTRLSRW